MARGLIRIVPDGKTLSVTFTNAAGGTPTAYTTETGSSTHTLPLSITATTEFWLEGPDTFTVSAKLNGVEIAGDRGATRSVRLRGAQHVTLNPSVDVVEEIAGAIGSGTSGTVAYTGSAWPARPSTTSPVIWSGPLAAGRPSGALATDIVFLYSP